jgi:dihydroxyacetone kinase-like predicted kinase
MVLVATDSVETPAGNVESGQAIGIAEGAIVTIDFDAASVASEVAKALLVEGRELLTVLCAAEVHPAERERLRAMLTEKLPEATIEIHEGGQPVHRYVLAAE